MRGMIIAMLLFMSLPVKAESIPLIHEHGTLVVPVVINNKVTVNFTIDTGASDVSIPADVFSTLTRAGTVSQDDLLDKQSYELADGTRRSSQRFRIRSLRVGSVEVRDVVASVAPQAGILLLGQSFLSRIKSWSIDNERQVLLINESSIASPATAVPHDAKKSSGSKWTLVGESDNGELKVFFDLSTLRVNGGVRHVWAKEVSARAADADDQEIDHEIVLEAFDCQNGMERWESFTQYLTNGKVIHAAPELFPKPWSPVPPDTVVGNMMKYICAGKPR